MTKCMSPLCHQESSQKTIHKCLDYYVHLKKPILPVIDTDILSYLKREIINDDSDMSFVAKRTPPAQTIHSAPTNSTPSTAVKTNSTHTTATKTTQLPNLLPPMKRSPEDITETHDHLSTKDRPVKKPRKKRRKDKIHASRFTTASVGYSNIGSRKKGHMTDKEFDAEAYELTKVAEEAYSKGKTKDSKLKLSWEAVDAKAREFKKMYAIHDA